MDEHIILDAHYDTSESEGSITNKTDILGIHLDSLHLLSTCGELAHPHGWPWTKL